MRVSLFPDLTIENWKSMDRYADRLRAWLPVVADQCEIRWAQVKPSRWLDRYLGVPYIRRVLNDRFYSRYVVYARAARAFQGDVNHVLDHSYGHLLRVLDPERTVVTVHDLYPFHLMDERARTPRQLGRARLLRWVMKHALRARWLIANSAWTRWELMHRTGYPASRISVIHMGVDDAFFRPIDEATVRQYRRSLAIPSSATLILHVGTCDRRKNIPSLLKTIERLTKGMNVDAYLLQIGGRFMPDQERFIDRLGLNARIRQRSRVSMRELICAYQAADVLLLPSTYEGFGMPALEAMAAGTPVVVANIGAFREIVGDAGLLVPPTDPVHQAEVVASLLEDAHLKARLIERGRARAARFSWMETARKTLAVYRRLYSGGV